MANKNVANPYDYNYMAYAAMAGNPARLSAQASGVNDPYFQTIGKPLVDGSIDFFNGRYDGPVDQNALAATTQAAPWMAEHNGQIANMTPTAQDYGQAGMDLDTYLALATAPLDGAAFVSSPTFARGAARAVDFGYENSPTFARLVNRHNFNSVVPTRPLNEAGVAGKIKDVRGRRNMFDQAEDIIDRSVSNSIDYYGGNPQANRIKAAYRNVGEGMNKRNITPEWAADHLGSATLDRIPNTDAYGIVKGIPRSSLPYGETPSPNTFYEVPVGSNVRSGVRGAPTREVGLTDAQQFTNTTGRNPTITPASHYTSSHSYPSYPANNVRNALTRVADKAIGSKAPDNVMPMRADYGYMIS